MKKNIEKLLDIQEINNKINSKTNVRLILDNNVHKVLAIYNGKQQKITIGSIDENIIDVNKIVNEINEISSSAYSLNDLEKLYKVSKLFPKVSRYSQKALEIYIKMIDRDILDKFNENDDLIYKKEQGEIEPTKILNLGKSGVGKTNGIISLLVRDTQYLKYFKPLISIKESTNYKIKNVINKKGCIIDNNEKYEVINENELILDIKLKTEKFIKDDIENLILDALFEFINAIANQIDINNNLTDEDIYQKSIDQIFESKLYYNTDKTLNIDKYTEEEEKYIKKCLGISFIEFIKNKYSNSISYYNRLTDETVINYIIDSCRNKKIELNEIEDICNYKVNIQEFKEIYNILEKKVLSVKEQFKINYNHRIDFFSETLDFPFERILIKDNFENLKEENILDNIFRNKRKVKDDGYFTIDNLILEVTLYVKNEEINYGSELIIYDSIGITQGNLKGKDTIIYNVNNYIQDIKPDFIVYNTTVEKDEYLDDIITNLAKKGYKDRIFISYGKIDNLMSDYLEENLDKSLNDIEEEDYDSFKTYLKDAYIERDLGGLENYINKYFYCDKALKLNKMNSSMFYDIHPKNVLNCMLNEFNQIKHKYQNRTLNNKTIDDILNIMQNNQMFSNIYTRFKQGVDNQVTMNYNHLRWNTLEYGIEGLKYGNNNSVLSPSIILKEEFVNVLDLDNQNLDDQVKSALYTFFEKFTDIINILLITSYKLEYETLYDMRINRNLRKILNKTLTDERKITLRDIFKGFLENKSISVDRCMYLLTKYVLENL